MIKVTTKFDGANDIIFQYSETEELNYLNEYANDILDKFVQIKIKNIGNMNIKTFKEYVDFCTASLHEQLEIIEGKTIKHSDFGKLEAQNAFILSQKATEELSFRVETLNDLEILANKMFEEFKSHTDGDE